MSNVELLLDSLTEDLPSNVQQLISNDPSLQSMSLEYLNSAFATDSKILKDTEDHISSLVNEVAELDAAQNRLEDKLKKTVVSSSKEIIESRLQLDKIVNGLSKDFAVQLQQISETLEQANGYEEDRAENGNGNGNGNENENVSFTIVNELSKMLKRKTPSALILANMESITDILELPSLVGACVKAGYYHETLEISSYTRRLSIRYPDIDIIKEVELGVKLEIEAMLVGLLKLLKTDLKQSNIVKIMSYLRRIYPFNVMGPNSSLASNTNSTVDSLDIGILELDSNSLLQRIYFHSRYQFIVGELELLLPLKKHSVEKYLKHVNELIREHCFTSILTYQSLFPASEDILASKASNDDILRDVSFSENQKLIHGFVSHVIHKYAVILRENFPRIKDQQTRDSLILQIMYCSQSLGRVQGEFSSIILDELNILDEEECIISEKEWFKVLKKQKSLMKNLNGV